MDFGGLDGIFGGGLSENPVFWVSRPPKSQKNVKKWPFLGVFGREKGKKGSKLAQISREPNSMQSIK